MHYSNKQRKLLFDKINVLSSTEHEEIYKIIADSMVNVSKNKNGVFFNLSSIDDEVVGKIEAFVDYCLQNKEQLDDYDKKLNECKLMNKVGKIENMNIRLEELVTNENQLIKDDWTSIKSDTKATAKVAAIIQKMNEDREKLCIKKANSKFITAKKKYSKKQVIDIDLLRKKFDFEQAIELVQETYLL